MQRVGKAISITLTDAQYRWIERISIGSGNSMASIARHVVEAGIKSYKRKWQREARKHDEGK